MPWRPPSRSPTSPRCAEVSNSIPTAIRSRTFISPRSPNVPTANSRPRLSRRCSRITVTATPRIARRVTKWIPVRVKQTRPNNDLGRKQGDEERDHRHHPGQRGHAGNFLEYPRPDLCAEKLHRAFLLLACDAAIRHLRAPAYPSGPGRISLYAGRKTRFHARRRRGPGDAGRSDTARDGRSPRHLQQVRPDREGAVLGIADQKALRSVLGPSQHEGAETRGRRGHGRGTQHPLPAAAAGGVREVTKRICHPTGKSAKTCPAPFAKIFRFFRNTNQAI